MLWLVFLGCMLLTMPEPVTAQTAQDNDQTSTEQTDADQTGSDPTGRVDPDSLDSPTEPSTMLPLINRRIAEKDSLIPVSPLGWLRDGTSKATEAIYDASGLQLGGAFAQVFQVLSDSIKGEGSSGTAGTIDLIGSWELINRGEPSQGEAVFHLQSRWDFNTTGPEDLGGNSLASLIGTADTYSSYSKPVVLRNLYWRQGSPEAGWVYRVGKITPDALLAASPYLDSQTTFLSSGGTGSFAIALPDSGIGAVGAKYFGNRAALAALVSDANGDREDFGNIGEGDLFAAVELDVKILPRTSEAPYSKLTLWYTDGTKDRKAVNAELGPSGWGFFLLHQQELTADGRAIGIVRYGKSFDDSAIYEHQAGAHLLFYEPRLVTHLKNDVVGVGFNWAKSTIEGSRSEYNSEIFYKFPLFPEVDTTLSYQYVIHPALTREVDDASVFSLRIRTVF